jgi:CheY-like chemotaxis protein
MAEAEEVPTIPPAPRIPLPGAGSETRAAQVPAAFEPAEVRRRFVAAALAAGADEYVTKPFTKDALTSKLGIIGLLVD